MPLTIMMAECNEARAEPPPVLVLRALSGDGSLLGTLETEAFRGRVHSVFERVVNFESAGGPLLTLACSEFDNGPNTIVIDGSGFGAIPLVAGDPVTAADGVLTLGQGLAVQLTGAARWECTLPEYASDDAALRANLRRVESHLLQLATAGGMTAGPGAQDTFADEVTTALRMRAKLLLFALSRGNVDSARSHANSLIGLGPGLTPSGDDFLVGLFAVLNVAGSPCHALRSACPYILAGAGHRTNAISLAALTMAAAGRVRESIAMLLQRMMVGTSETLPTALDRVLAIGSTSGADLVAGIVSGFELNLQVEASRSMR